MPRGKFLAGLSILRSQNFLACGSSAAHVNAERDATRRHTARDLREYGRSREFYPRPDAPLHSATVAAPRDISVRGEESGRAHGRASRRVSPLAEGANDADVCGEDSA